MRILLPTIRDPDQIGGGGTHLTMLVDGLAQLGHDPKALYLTATMPGLLARGGLVWPAGALNRLRTGWGMVYSADMRGRLLANATAKELDRVTAGPWEVLNAQEAYSVPHLRSVADDHHIPLVLTLHGYPLYESVSEGYSTSSQMGLHFLMRTEMQALRLADAVVTVDTRLYHHVMRLVPERADTVYTLMNFIDTSVFAPLGDATEDARLRDELRKSWEIPEGKIVLLCPRRLVKKNGVVYPSLALAEMAAADRDRFLLLHAGEGGERQEIERIIAQNRLEEHVRLLGGQSPDAVRDLYRLADIVLVPSIHSENVEEATSLSALEAMASGRPLIAGDVGGLAEMVVDGETGLLVPADADALAAAILRMAAAPELGVRMAAAAREYVAAKHSHVRAATAYAEVYERAVRALEGSRGTGAPLSSHPLKVWGAEEGSNAPGSCAGQPPLQTSWPSVSVLGFTLDIVTLEQAACWAIAAAEETSPIACTTADFGPRRTRIAVSFNPELVVRAQRDPAAAAAFLEADLCYPDGVGAIWAAGRQGARGQKAVEATDVSGSIMASAAGLERVPGVDLAQRVLELAAHRGLSVFFLGAAEGVAAEAARRQKQRFPSLKVAGTWHGYFTPAEEDEVIRKVRGSGARILLVAMGAPQQEVLLHRHRHELGVGVALGVGGSFDVWAGVVSRAPVWTQKAKVEWLYRLVSNPRRARRQVALPSYAAQVLRWSVDDYGPPRRGRGHEKASGLPPKADTRGADQGGNL